MGKGKFWSTLGLVSILLLSALIQFTVVARTSVLMAPGSDAGDYFSYAYNLKHEGTYSNYRTWAIAAPPGGILPDALRPPGYPLFLLAIPGIEPGTAYTHRVYLAQAALAVASVLLAFLIAGTFLRPGWSHLAALVMAIAPHLATMSTNLLSEGLFLFVLLASVYATIRAARTQTRRAAIYAGLLWGACSLVRATTVFTAPLLLAATLLIPTLKPRRSAALLFLLAFLLVQLPWFVRNVVSPLDKSERSLMVDALHQGTYPNLMYQGRPETLGWPFRYDPNRERVERDLSSVTAEIVAKFRSDPATYLKWYLVGKPGYLFSWGYAQGHDIFVYKAIRSPYLDDARFAALRLISHTIHWPLMMLGLLAVFVVFWRPGWLCLEGDQVIAARIVAAVVLYAIAFHMVAAPYPRYGVPFRPLLYMLAAVCISAPLIAFRRSSSDAVHEEHADRNET